MSGCILSEDLVKMNRIISVNENDVIISKSLICFCPRPSGGRVEVVRMMIGYVFDKIGWFLYG